MFCFFKNIKRLFTCPQSEQEFLEEVKKHIEEGLKNQDSKDFF